MIGIKELNKAMWAFANAGVSKILLHPDNFDKLCLAAHILYPSSRRTIYGIYVEKSLLAPADGWIDVLKNGEYRIHKPKNDR